MDILPSLNIFRELQDIHDTGYFSAQPSLEEHWQQVGVCGLVPAFGLIRVGLSSPLPAPRCRP
ncbi:Krueppel-like factor 6 [Frankliniella occidentalis]|uniref:Krueppel-like factor 6 n=1 Tax=Frankliniella occidentalis TaxID=133901 RepID=A0A9C6U3W3_FRAOC|nr:Krueppel-like factor 6 [Frankliniella occidentalis]